MTLAADLTRHALALNARAAAHPNPHVRAMGQAAATQWLRCAATCHLSTAVRAVVLDPEPPQPPQSAPQRPVGG